MPKQSITYILGAGASFQSFPIVNSFPHRFSRFTDNIDMIIKDQRSDTDTSQKFGLLLDSSKVLSNEFRAHSSFDTFFKKLFHTEEFSQIKLYKKILNIYFIWEHLATIESIPTDFKGDIFTKRSQIDKRYDAFIAGLLKPIKNKKETFCNINIISWNYDLDLLSSLKNYYYPKASFKEFFEETKSDTFELRIGNHISILNMNGYFYTNCFDSCTNIRDVFFNECVTKKITSDFFDYSFDDNDSNLIRFAWELSDENLASIIKSAKQFIQQSDNLIVIGYTFPLYNRLIDIKYLTTDSLLHKDIIIQDPRASEIRDDFITNFSLPSNNLPLRAKASCDNFFVPEGIFQPSNEFLSSM